jgi:hypothetical protein
MERATIEKRDREVVEKFRAVVDAKEHRKKIARMRLFGVALVVVCAGGILFSKQFSPQVTAPVRHSSNHVAVARRPVDQQPVHSTDIAPLDQKGLNQEAPEALRAIEPAEPVPFSKPVDDGVAMVREKTPQAPSFLRPAPGLKSYEKITAPDPTRILKPRPGLEGKSPLASAGKSFTASSQARIAEIVTCKGVDKRQPVSRQKVFSMGKGENPHVWMDVRSKDTPQTLRHVYYHNGRPYWTVRLDIRYSLTRTWSNISLKHPHESGQWRVDVVTGKGDILSRAEFTVVF